MQNKWLIPISVVLGVMIGRNWGKIQKYSRPYAKVLETKVADAFSTATRFAVEQKEHLEDMLAASKVKKTAPAVAAVTVVKKRGHKKASVSRKRAVVRYPA